MCYNIFWFLYSFDLLVLGSTIEEVDYSENKALFYVTILYRAFFWIFADLNFCIANFLFF